MGPLSSDYHFEPLPAAAAEAAASGDLLKMQVLQPHLGPTESETLRWDPETCGSMCPPGDVMHTKYGNLCFKIS